MATIDGRPVSPATNGLDGFQAWQGLQRNSVIELDIDLTDTDVWPAGLAASAADVGQIYDLPAGVMVNSAVIYVDATDGAVDANGDDLDVGLVDTETIAANADLIDNADITSIAAANYFEGASANGRGVLANIPMSIVIVNNNAGAMTTGKFKLLISVTDYISQNDSHPGVSTG